MGTSHRFKPGQSGNPGGRPKGSSEWTELLKEKTPEVLQKLFALTDSDKQQIALKAIEIVLSYALPKPKQEQSIEVTGPNGSYIGIDAPRSETREEWLARRAKQNANGINGAHGATNGITPHE